MNSQSTVEQMQDLKLFGMARLYQAVIDQPVHQHPEAHTLIGMLTDAETQARLSQRTQLFLGYPNSVTIQCLSRSKRKVIAALLKNN